MEAGLELEALIHEKIMGFPQKKLFKPYDDSNYLMYIPSGKPRRTHAIDARPLPWFSRSIDAAWYIVLKLEQRGYWCQMRTPFEAGAEGDGYWAGFTPHNTTGWNGKPDHWTQAESLPLAICLSALKVVKVQL